MNIADIKIDTTAEVLKSMAHPVRLCIVYGLAEKGECNVAFMQHCLESPQSTISQHLQKLRSAGVVTARRQGLEVYYRLANENITRLVLTIKNAL